MRDFKNALIVCACIAFLSIVGIAIWTVRQYLPIVGIILLVVLILAVLLALAYVVEHLHRRFFRYEHIQISQYGSVLHRRNAIVEIAPYQSQARITAPSAAQIIDTEITEEEDMPVLAAHILTFAQLLERGIVQAAIAQGKMLLGYDAVTHQLRYGSWLDLYSAGNGGVSGSGKSTTTRFLLFQAVLASARLIMIDPHIGDPDESLSHQFSLLPPSIHQIKPCDGRDSNVSKRVAWLSRELDRRKKTAMKLPFLVFVIDEFNSLMRHASKEVRDDLAALLLDIEQEGRKFGMFALLIGQRWSAQDLGGADIRSSLASKMAHRFSDEDQAKRFIGSKYARALLELETGHWLFYDTKGKTSEMVTPETLASDGGIIASIMSQSQEYTPEISYESTLKPRETTLQIPERTTGDLEEEASSFDVESTTESTEKLALARQIIQLQATGMQKAEIMRRIWNVSPGGTEAYRQAQEQYQQTMSFIAEQIGG